MSSPQTLPQNSSSSDTTSNVKHIDRLSKDFAELHNSEFNSDLTLIVADQKFQAHKSVLAARSLYFRALLFGGLKETNQKEIELKDANPAAFEALLNYIYTGRISLDDKTETVMVHIVNLAHLYSYPKLGNSIVDYLHKILSIHNACSIYDAAILYKLEFLTSICLEFMDKYATAILQHESFLQLSSAAVNKLISRDSFYAPGIEIFLAVQSWVKVNPESGKDSVLSKVKLDLMTAKQLLHIVKPTEFFSSDMILDTIAEKISDGDEIPQYRKRVVEEVVPDLNYWQIMSKVKMCLQLTLHQSVLNSDTTGNINHLRQLSKDFAQLHNSDNYSDLTLIVADQKFHTHKIVLAARSLYFRALLFGGLKESSEKEIELKDASPAAFEALLNYIYTGRISLADKTETVVFHILGLAHLYGFLELEDSILDYFREILSIRNICPIYDAAILYKLEFLTSICLEFMDKYATAILQHESFLQLSSAAANNLISRDSFCAPEIEIFLAVQSWVTANPESDKEGVLKKVKLDLMTPEELVEIVRPSELFSSEAILDAIAMIIPEGDVIPQCRQRE